MGCAPASSSKLIWAGSENRATAYTSFDFATQELSAKYEATQGCSSTFNAFARRLAERWAGAYLGPDKLALEIGCGRGEFLRLLHEVRLARQITHPAVCRVFDVGESDGDVFYSM